MLDNVAAQATAGDGVRNVQQQTDLEFRLRELNHRFKNTLAMILSVIDTTAASAESVEDLADRLKTRVAALAQLHDALVRTDGAELDVLDMARMALRPHADSAEQLEVRGVSRHVPSDVAHALFLALHELAVNARKHGALSVPEGRIVVEVHNGDPDRLELVWTERGGPPPGSRKRDGFGMSVITRGLAYEAGGTADLAFDPSGLRARLSVPLEAEPR